MILVDRTGPAKAYLTAVYNIFADNDVEFDDRVRWQAIAAGRFLAIWPGAGSPIDGESAHEL